MDRGNRQHQHCGVVLVPEPLFMQAPLLLELEMGYNERRPTVFQHRRHPNHGTKATRPMANSPSYPSRQPEYRREQYRKNGRYTFPSAQPEARREYYRKNAKRINEQNNARRQRNPAQARAANKKRYENNTASILAQIRVARLQKRYGITVKDYQALLLDQEGRCALCGTDRPGPARVKYFCIDHCHSTGRNRSLLCTRCNFILGYANDDPAHLERAAAYLRQWVEVHARLVERGDC
jgi:hypothetical protein